MADFEIIAGDDVSITGTLTGYTTIAGFTITLGATPQPGKAAVLTKTATITGAVAGTFAFTLVPADTASLSGGEYVYDIKVVDTGGKIVHTATSSFLLSKPVTS